MAIFYVPAVNLIGKGVVNEVGPYIKELGYKKALLVTDKYIEGSDILPKTLKPLDTEGIEYVIFSDVEPNPTCKNVTDGVAALQEHGCDFIISLGGGSPQDAASCISIMATNGGKPQDYEGLHKSAKKGLPVVAINTTAGTSAEITINYVITDEERKVKMVMVDKNSLALISVNDPELMLSKPKGLTAATGMDALTHAVEALVTPGAYDVTKKLSIGAIELIKEYLPRAVENGHDIEAREGMVNAIFLGGMSFNNAGLGYVHSMAHQLGAVYNLPHGVCCAMLLPVIERENAKRVPEAFRNVAKALGLHVEGKSDQECADYAIVEIEKLSETVGIPKKLTELGIEEKDFDFEYLSKNALISVNDPELMLSKPKGLTAATGMDALTHAVEALVTPGAYDVTKKLSIGAIELIKEYLPRAVENGHDIEAREGMVNAIFLGGMSFNNAGLGYVHSMAHQLGAVYNLPHGVCCAMLLPVIERENAKRVPEAFRNVAKALGLHVEGKSDQECADYAIAEIEKLSETVGIPKKLTELGIEEKDFDFEYLSKNALIDACAPGNPFMPTLEETIAFYKELF
ncbi:alcohol dehydrogenase [Streptococcus pneumoniae]|nr:alcohol dehydrogenase [Streptococcus pneumoniae]